jgi:serine phosphatase RsbU (regulator of sigma subunit)
LPAASELCRVAERTQALALLRHHAAVRGCDVAVRDAADGEICAREGLAGPARSDPDAAVARVEVFDRELGVVVAAPRAGTVRGAMNGVPADVAARGAALLADLCSREFELNDLSREILGAYEELNLFYEISADLAGASDGGAIAQVIARKAAGVLRAVRTWVLLADGSGVLHLAAAHEPPDGTPDHAPSVTAARGAAGRAIRARQADLVEDAASAAAGALAGWETSATRALLSVPVCVPDREDRPVLGVLQVVGAPEEAAFTAGEVKLATALASHAAVLLENQRLIEVERELHLARTIQQSLLPAVPPHVAGLDVAGRCVAATSVGGDFWDHFTMPDGDLALVVADVSGHNLAAALVQTAARSTIRAYGAAGGGPAGALDGVNRALHDDLSRADMFLTAWFGAVDARTGRLRHADAGHAPALVYRAATDTVSDLAAGGLPIGVVPDGGYEQGEARLEPGDVLLVFTDGLTETVAPADGAEYGIERLADALREAARNAGEAGCADEIADRMLEDVARYGGGAPAADDRSLVIVKRCQTGSR